MGGDEEKVGDGATGGGAEAAPESKSDPLKASEPEAVAQKKRRLAGVGSAHNAVALHQAKLEDEQAERDAQEILAHSSFDHSGGGLSRGKKAKSKAGLDTGAPYKKKKKQKPEAKGAGAKDGGAAASGMPARSLVRNSIYAAFEVLWCSVPVDPPPSPLPLSCGPQKSISKSISIVPIQLAAQSLARILSSAVALL